MLELFKNDAFSVASEIQRRAEEGSIANPNTGDRGRPIYTNQVRVSGRSEITVLLRDKNFCNAAQGL